MLKTNTLALLFLVDNDDCFQSSFVKIINANLFNSLKTKYVIKWLLSDNTTCYCFSTQLCSRFQTSLRSYGQLKQFKTIKNNSFWYSIAIEYCWRYWTTIGKFHFYMKDHHVLLRYYNNWFFYQFDVCRICM